MHPVPIARSELFLITELFSSVFLPNMCDTMPNTIKIKPIALSTSHEVAVAINATQETMSRKIPARRSDRDDLVTPRTQKKSVVTTKPIEDPTARISAILSVII